MTGERKACAPFVAEEKSRDVQPLQEIPVRQRRQDARALTYDSKRCASRDRAIAEAYRSGAYNKHEVGAWLGQMVDQPISAGRLQTRQGEQ